MDPDARIRNASELLGYSNVVGVGMAHQHRADVAHGPAEGCQGCRELVPMRGEPGINECQVGAFSDEIEVHVRVAGAPDARHWTQELHGRGPRRTALDAWARSGPNNRPGVHAPGFGPRSVRRATS